MREIMNRSASIDRFQTLSYRTKHLSSFCFGKNRLSFIIEIHRIDAIATAIFDASLRKQIFKFRPKAIASRKWFSLQIAQSSEIGRESFVPSLRFQLNVFCVDCAFFCFVALCSFQMIQMCLKISSIWRASPIVNCCRWRKCGQT